MPPSYLQPAALCPGVDSQALFNKSIIGLTCALAVCGLAFSSMVNAKTVQVTSPDTHISISLTDDNGRPEYQVQFNGNTSTRITKSYRGASYCNWYRCIFRVARYITILSTSALRAGRPATQPARYKRRYAFIRKLF